MLAGPAEPRASRGTQRSGDAAIGPALTSRLPSPLHQLAETSTFSLQFFLSDPEEAVPPATNTSNASLSASHRQAAILRAQNLFFLPVGAFRSWSVSFCMRLVYVVSWGPPSRLFWTSLFFSGVNTRAGPDLLHIASLGEEKSWPTGTT